MKALTICQPWAELIAQGAKRVENRTWRTHYRGPLAIHAGLSRGRVRGSGFSEEELSFGAIVAVAELYDVLTLEEVQLCTRHDLTYAEGPLCWMLRDARRLATPIPCRGYQQLWNVPAAIAKQLDR